VTLLRSSFSEMESENGIINLSDAGLQESLTAISGGMLAAADAQIELISGAPAESIYLIDKSIQL
jgi:hypothetical protein